jgi:hypothetical protein
VNILERLKSKPDFEGWQLPVAPINRLTMQVTLSAEDRARRRILADSSFFIAGPRGDLGARWWRSDAPTPAGGSDAQRDLLRLRYRGGPLDIEAKINRMLGRDPNLHRPQRLAWEPLISALARADVRTTEEELITRPLMVELDEDVRTILEEP